MIDWSELQNWNEYLKLLIGLFAIVGPLSVIPTFLTLVAGLSDAAKQRVVSVASITVLITLLLFTFFGKQILDLFSISLAAFRIAGGILLMMLALDMLRASPNEPEPGELKPATNALSIALAPLAIPLLSGPGAISTIVIYSAIHESFTHKLLVAAVVFTVAVLINLILRLALRTGNLIGPNARIVMNRVMGLIVASIAVEFILDALADHFPSLGPIVH